MKCSVCGEDKASSCLRPITLGGLGQAETAPICDDCRDPKHIKVERLREEELKKRGVFGWPIWTKEVSRFDWEYDSTEECYFLEGDVTVHTPDGKKENFGKGDFVTFPIGLSCTWEVKKPVKKHYNFK